MNNIMTIVVYRTGATRWASDDPSVGLLREPFVAGADVIISKLVDRYFPRRPQRAKLIFSGAPFPGEIFRLDWHSLDGGGNWYESKDFNMRGWLCPALFKYFDKAPKKIYIRAMAA